MDALKQEYYNFFKHMEDEDKKLPLGGMAWDEISYWAYDAIEVDKVYTEEELKATFPYLFG